MSEVSNRIIRESIIKRMWFGFPPSYSPAIFHSYTDEIQPVRVLCSWVSGRQHFLSLWFIWNNTTPILPQNYEVIQNCARFKCVYMQYICFYVTGLKLGKHNRGTVGKKWMSEGSPLQILFLQYVWGEHMLKVMVAKEKHETGEQVKQIIFQNQQLLLHFVDIF